MSSPLDPADMTASAIAAAVATRKLSAKEATEAALSRIAARDGVLNAFTDVTA
ncbi:AtzE family amidohydrolase, partial [Salmonella enterica subsp. enterica serovar Enteritidis]|nr:AtzE family amidohydrolase [Salmonella enterica subsp. enterica serovar Enteritidis]